jgi:hypothetical protein
LCNILGLNACILTWFGNIGLTLSLVFYKLLFFLCVSLFMCLKLYAWIRIGFLCCLSYRLTLLGRSLQLLFLVRAFLTPLNIWFGIAFYHAFVDALITFFLILGLILGCVSTPKSFSKKKTFKRLGFIHENWNIQCMHQNSSLSNSH